MTASRLETLPSTTHLSKGDTLGRNTMKHSLIMTTAVSALIVNGGLLSTASAQDADEDSFGLEEIIITAERRAASLQDVPVAVSAFTASELDARQINEPIDIVDYIPNLFGANNTGLGTANSYYLRGIGNTESIATFDPPVGTYVDNVYIARQNGNNVSFFDVERVEVLRGPQGTLFGRNTTGGAISVHMKKPSEEAGGFLELGYGDFGRWQARASVDTPISDTVLTKLSAFFVDGDGFVDNITTGQTLNGEKSYGVRGDLRVKSDDFTWDLALEYIDDESANIVSAFPGQTVFDGPPSGNSTDRFSQTGIRATSTTGTVEQLSQGEGLGNNVESWGITSTFNWGVDFGSFELISSYRELSQDFILDFFDGTGAQGGFTIANQGQHNQHSQELKYASEDTFENLSVVAGIYYFKEDNFTDLTDVFALPFGNLVLADRQIENDLETYAGYVQGDYSLNEKLIFTAGVRWTREEKNIIFTDTENDLLAAGLPNLLVFPTAPEAELTNANLTAAGIPTTQVQKEWTPRFALQYRANDDFMMFASATRGFKSGGWNARATAPEEATAFTAEKVWSYEAGFRSEWLDNRLRINLTAFYMDVSDFQVPSAFVRSNGSIAFITNNFADLENKGIELEVTAVPVPGLNIYGSLGLQDGEQKPGAPIQAQVDECLAGVPSTAGLGIVDANCNIADPTRTPDVTLNIGANYLIAINEDVSVQPSVNYRYVGSQNISTNGVGFALADGYSNINAAIAFSFLDDQLSLIAECNNCTNEVIQTAILANTVYYNEPRRFNFRLKYDF